MSSNSPASISNYNRLYIRFIKALKVIQYVGYFIIAINISLNFIILHELLLEFQLFDESQVKITLSFLGLGIISSSGSEAKWIIITYGVSAIFTVYIITQSLIAIIDLLSRIERNTRIEK